MPLYGKTREGRWFEFALPEGEPLQVGEYFRDPTNNAMIAYFQIGGEMPENPPPPEPVVIHRPELERPVVAVTDLVAETPIPPIEPSVETTTQTTQPVEVESNDSVNSTITPVTAPVTDEATPEPVTPPVVEGVAG